MFPTQAFLFPFGCAADARCFYLSFILFIDLQTANDGRPRPEKIIGNAKVNKIGTHTQNLTKRQHGRW